MSPSCRTTNKNKIMKTKIDRHNQERELLADTSFRLLIDETSDGEREAARRREAEDRRAAADAAQGRLF